MIAYCIEASLMTASNTPTELCAARFVEDGKTQYLMMAMVLIFSSL